MTSPRPAFYVNFATTPNYLDPRITFSRTGTASFINQRGLVAYVAANTPRWTFDPITGECLGVIIEPAKTNSALQSEDFSNASWTKTNCSVTSNSVAAPDGAVTGDTLIASTTAGQISQAATIVSGEALVFSVYAKAASSNFLQLSITDGTNPVDAWYNLAAGAIGSTYTSGAGNCLYSFRQIDALPDGWYRCGLGITNASAVSFTCSIRPTATDGTTSAAGNSAYAWGAQIEAGSFAGVSSYIPTTVSTVARSADSLITSVSVLVDKWFSPTSGTIYFDWITNVPTNASTSFVVGGIGDTFANTVYVGKWSTSVAATYIRNSSGISRLLTIPILSVGSRIKVFTSWSSSRVAISSNGYSTYAASSGTSYVPASTNRLTIGGSPWVSPSDGAVFGIFRAAAYYPYQLTDTEMQVLSAL